MKLLVVPSALDLKHPLGATPVWWQLLKALNENGVDVVATPYYGRSVTSLWWRSYENPTYRLGAMYSAVTRFPQRPPAVLRRSKLRQSVETRSTRLVVAPRWLKHLSHIIENEGDVTAVIFLTAPPNHLAGVGAAIRERFGLPVLYYDADLPMGLTPSYGRFDSDFDRYHGARLSEYDLVLSISQGVLGELLQMGARRVDHLWFAADPDVFRPMATEKEIDVFFYGHGVEQKEDNLRSMITLPSNNLPQRRFVVAGSNLDMDLGRAERVGSLSPAELRRCIAKSRLQVYVPRAPQTTVYASSSPRIFELAAMAETIVSVPINGIEEWFQPGEELEVVDSAEAATEAYEALIGDGERRRALAVAARQRLLNEHTYRHRAHRVVDLLGSVMGSASPD